MTTPDQDIEVSVKPHVRYASTPWILLFGAILGLIASFELTVDKIQILSDPNFIPSCNINPVLSCGSVIVTEQASLFGFPNPLIGLAGYSVIITLAVLLISRVTIPKWVWLGLNLGALGGMAFVVWLAFQSLYVIGALCPWCMVAWVGTIFIFWITTAENAAQGRFTRSGTPGVVSEVVYSLRWIFISLTFVLIITLIFIRWMDFWLGNG
ncbi:MAG: vitamin K epoxide reductase family protein [Candidatus Nanopelagicales bacterium]